MKGKNLITHLTRLGAYSVSVMFASLLLINNLAVASHAEPVMTMPARSTLEVQVVGDPDRITWGEQRTIDIPQTLRFQWKTNESGVHSATWKVGAGPFVAGGKDPHIVASGNLSEVPAQGESRSFWIDFKPFLSRPPENARKYYVQVWILDGQRKTLGTSNSVEISYVKDGPGLQFPKEDSALTKLNLVIWTGVILDAADADFNVDINFRNGSSRTVWHLNRGFQWEAHSEHVLTIPFEQPISLTEVKSLTLWAELHSDSIWKTSIEVVAFFSHPNRRGYRGGYDIAWRDIIFTGSASRITIPIHWKQAWNP